jgi:hypothetical protein
MPLDWVRRHDYTPSLTKQMACEGLLAAPLAAEARQAGEVRQTVEEAARKAEGGLLPALWSPGGQVPGSELT